MGEYTELASSARSFLRDFDKIPPAYRLPILVGVLKKESMRAYTEAMSIRDDMDGIPKCLR